MAKLEEACHRLQKEIEALKEENGQLEKLYMANGLHHLTNTCSEQVLTDWIQDAVDNMIGKKSNNEELGGESKLAYLMSKTLDWNLDSCFCNAKLDASSTSKAWQTRWTHKKWNDLSTVNMVMTVLQNEKETKITNLLIVPDGLASQAEVQPLIEKCTQLCQPSKFFSHFETYLQMHSDRVEFIQQKLKDVEVQFNRSTGSYRLIFRSESKKQALVALTWNITFDPKPDAFKHSYLAAFTVEGQKAAEECNFPEDLINLGTYKEWDVISCLENLSRMAVMCDDLDNQEESPVRYKRPKK